LSFESNIWKRQSNIEPRRLILKTTDNLEQNRFWDRVENYIEMLGFNSKLKI